MIKEMKQFNTEFNELVKEIISEICAVLSDDKDDVVAKGDVVANGAQGAPVPAEIIEKESEDFIFIQ